MKRKLFCLLIAAALLLSGCCLRHEWVDADCVNPKTCAKCEKTEGEALGHSWAEATCTAPKTCSVCAATEGEPLPHDVKWNFHREEKTMDGDCSACGEHVEQELDWVLAADDRITGRWNARYVSNESGMAALDSGYLDCREDGTFELMLLDMTVEGTWSFDRVEDNIVKGYIYKLVDAEDSVYWVIFMLDADNNFTMKLSNLAITFSKAA